MKIRVSIGSAIALGLMKGPLDAAPCMTYLMLPGTCEAKCSYCTWGREDYLSRVRWPEFDTEMLKGLRRYCLQTVEREGMESEMDEALGSLEGEGDVAIAYLTPERAEILYKHGVRSVGIGLDACTKALYVKHKPGLSWERAMDSFDYDFDLFCHVIIGLGESDEDFLTMSQHMHERGVRLALFAYTPVRGKRRVGGVSVERYRALQLASYLIEHGTSLEDFCIKEGKLVDIPHGFDERAFLTRGCENCNRPFYNERAGEEPYNFPAKRFRHYDIEGEIERYLRS